MQNWYVYHSEERMGHSYVSLDGHAVYSAANQPKLCFDDVIWVVEGDSNKPKSYYLVDCFHYRDTDYPPFPSGYSDFKLKVAGEGTLLNETVELSKGNEWFSTLHGKFITKQRFFSRMDEFPEVVAGLQDVSGISF